MDAVFIDSKGNKKNFLYQYDVGQTFVVENFEYENAPKVQFSIKSIKTMLSVSSTLNGTDLHVSIPDMLLTYGENIIAYLYIEDGQIGNTVETIFISVIPRKRPADYIYTDEMFARSVNGITMSKKCGIAEVAEWVDGNVNNENRNYLFVSAIYDANNDKLIINKASSLNNVYGVAVRDVGFASNCDESKLGSNGMLLQKYAYVCTSGFAKVKDNGACAVGSMCVPSSRGGIAAPSLNIAGYKVVGRVDDNHVLIFVDPSMQTINEFQKDIEDTARSLNMHIINTLNPHDVTKSQIGLGNVDNTSDVNKPVSTAQANAIADAKKAGTDAKEIIDGHVANINNPHGITKEQLGLGNVDNTSDANKPISTATQAALDTKPTLINGKLSKSVLPDDIGSIVIVNTIEERDALNTFDGLYVHVKDATGDTTVSAGWADYMYDGETWVKVASIASSAGEAGEASTVEWANITNKPSEYTPKAHDHDGIMPFISGTQIAATNAWTGVASFSSIYDGLSIRYWVPYSSTGNVTLNLTLSDGTSTGALKCYTTGGTYLFSEIAAGTIVFLTYRENVSLSDGTTISGWWATTGAGSSASNEFVMTDSMTGGQWTLGVENGKLILIPVGTVIEPLVNADEIEY